MKNFYHILGLCETASVQEINDAYKKLALKFHPDKNNDDPYYALLFKQINDAKQVLTNAEEKAEYDLLLTNYSDAYDLFKQQRLDDEFNRQIRRTQLEKSVARKKVVTVAAGMVIFLLMGFFLWAESDVLFGNNAKPEKPFQEVAQPALADVKRNLDSNVGLKETSVIEMEQPLPKDESTETRELKEFKRIKKPAKAKGATNFSQKELREILQSINAEKLKNNFKTNCITLKKTKTSNVDSDFSIANFLQHNGFIISGREIISQNLEGYKVEFNGVCLNLTIGRM